MSTDNQSAQSERDRAIAEFDRRYPTTFPTARRDIARAMFIEGWTFALAQAPAPSGEALLTWVLLIRPGFVPVRKGGFRDSRLVEKMVRDLYALHPGATCIVIDMPSASYPSDGREWVSMFGDQRRKPIPRTALASPGAMEGAQAAQPASMVTFLESQWRNGVHLEVYGRPIGQMRVALYIGPNGYQADSIADAVTLARAAHPPTGEPTAGKPTQCDPAGG